jgi:hypothetical protein
MALLLPRKTKVARPARTWVYRHAEKACVIFFVLGLLAGAAIMWGVMEYAT